MELTVVCGADHLTYWRAFADTPEPQAHERVRLLGFVADVRPLYVDANIVIVPHDRLGRHQCQSARGDGNAPCGSFDNLGLRRPGPRGS